MKDDSSSGGQTTWIVAPRAGLETVVVVLELPVDPALVPDAALLATAELELVPLADREELLELVSVPLPVPVLAVAVLPAVELPVALVVPVPAVPLPSVPATELAGVPVAYVV